jgi:copper chaperone NosL
MPETARRMGFALDTIVIASIASVAVVGLLVACGQRPTTGPGKVNWDRQTCDRCQMVISERRHAVQVRMPGEHGTHAFDDLGCALLWLDEQGLDESKPPLEVWVRDPTGAHWIGGHDARFEGGLSTPMAYGFGVAEGGISLGVVRQRVRDAERRRRSDRANPTAEEDGNRG